MSEKEGLRVPFHVEYSPWDECWVFVFSDNPDQVYFLETDHPDQELQAKQEAIAYIVACVQYDWES